MAEVAVVAAAALDAVPDFLKANLRFGSILARVSSKFCRRDLSAFIFQNERKVPKAVSIPLGYIRKNIHTCTRRRAVDGDIWGENGK